MVVGRGSGTKTRSPCSHWFDVNTRHLALLVISLLAFFREGLDHFARSSSGDERYFPKIWMNKGSVGSQRHYNKIYHQKRKVKRSWFHYLNS